MFGQTFVWSVAFALLALFFMLIAIVALSWRPRRMNFRRGMIGSVSASLAWFMIGVVSLLSGDAYGVAISALLGSVGSLFCTFMAYGAYRKHRRQQARMIVATHDVNIPRQR